MVGFVLVPSRRASSRPRPTRRCRWRLRRLRISWTSRSNPSRVACFSGRNSAIAPRFRSTDCRPPPGSSHGLELAVPNGTDIVSGCRGHLLHGGPPGAHLRFRPQREGDCCAEPIQPFATVAAGFAEIEVPATACIRPTRAAVAATKTPAILFLLDFGGFGITLTRRMASHSTSTRMETPTRSHGRAPEREMRSSCSLERKRRRRRWQ